MNAKNTIISISLLERTTNQALVRTFTALRFVHAAQLDAMTPKL